MGILSFRYAAFDDEAACTKHQLKIEECLNELKVNSANNEAIGKAFEACFKDSNGNKLEGVKEITY